MSHRDVDEGLRCVGLALVVFAQTPPTSQPTKGSFHDPTLALNMETLLSRNGFDDVQAFSELLPDPVHQLAGITTVSPNELNRAVGLKQSSEQALGRVPILHVGAGDHDDQHQTQRVHDQVTLGAIDLLAGIKTPDFIALGALDRLAVDDGGTRLGFAPAGEAELSAEIVVELDPEATENPVAVISVKDRPRREIAGDVAPLATGADDVENAIKDFAIGMFTRPSGLGDRFEEVTNELPLLIG